MHENIEEAKHFKEDAVDDGTFEDISTLCNIVEGMVDYFQKREDLGRVSYG